MTDKPSRFVASGAARAQIGRPNRARPGSTTTNEPKSLSPNSATTVTIAAPSAPLSFVTTATGIDGLEFVVRTAGTARTLVFRDAQHEYVFSER